MKLVLDTNVVLDWLHFVHPELGVLQQLVQQNRLSIVTHPALIEELRRVLAFSQFELEPAGQAAVLQRYESLTSPLAGTSVAAPTDTLADLPAGFPRCRDRDDNKFLAVAYYAKADALVSRDKAVLKLRRKSQRLGFQILTAPALLEALNAPLNAPLNECLAPA